MTFQPDNWDICEPSAVVKLPPKGLTGEELAKHLSDEVLPAYEVERGRLKKLEMWGTGRQPVHTRLVPQNLEKRVLQKFSRNPWIPLMVSTFAQQMIVDGFRKDGETENGPAWESWHANNMPAQQLTINRTTLIAGYSYLRITEGIGRDGKATAVMRAIDPQNAFGIYDDPYGDEYPQHLLEKRFDGTYRWWTSKDYTIFDHNNGSLVFKEVVAHPYGEVPFVRYVNQIDAKGRVWGDVEPVIEIAARLDKTVLDRLLVQHYNSFKVRWATGLEQPDTDEEVVAAKMKVAHDSTLISSNEQAKFGVMAETIMDPFIEAYRSDLETFLTVTQLPPDLAGQVANIAADALEGARRSTYQKLAEKQTMFGQSHAQALRLAAHIEGRPDEAADFLSRVHWQDVEIRSLAQFADAWGKICGQLGVPKWGPWHMIPGVDQATVDEWKENYFNDTGEDGKLNKYLRELGVKPDGASGGQGGTNSLQNQKPVTPDAPSTAV